MSYLVDRELEKLFENIDPKQINPASVDLTIMSYRRLKKTWRKVIGKPKKSAKIYEALTDLLDYKPDIFDRNHRSLFWDMENFFDNDEVELLPGEPILLSSAEYIEIPDDCIGFLISKSSFGRAFQEHLHAGFFDPGFKGVATLEVVNTAPFPVTLRFRQRIVQLVIFRGIEPDRTYEGRYQGQSGAEPVRGLIWKG